MYIKIKGYVLLLRLHIITEICSTRHHVWKLFSHRWEDGQPFARTLDVLDRWAVHSSSEVFVKAHGVQITIKQSVSSPAELQGAAYSQSRICSLF